MGRGDGSVFIDWISASQYHPNGKLPVLCGGLSVWYDEHGVARSERISGKSVAGSFDTRVRVGCDGYRVSLSGNVGRFGREDNLFNHGWEGTVAACNRVLSSVGLPPFSVASRGFGVEAVPCARLGRLDVTANLATGTDAQARAVIRWIASQSVARVKRGQAGDESVWWANSRYMFKAYLKWVEMMKHGGRSADEMAVSWAREVGVVRVEVEFKRRLLRELGLQDFETVTHERLEDAYAEQTSVLRRVDASDDPDVLAAVPARSRMFAAAWLAGQDVSVLCSRATLFRHAKVLRAYGLDIMSPRNLAHFPVRVRTIELQPLAVPDWYGLGEAA